MNLWTTITSALHSTKQKKIIDDSDPLQIQDRFGDILSKRSFEKFSDYRLIEKVGKGSVGTVYKAIHIPTQKEVAVKLIPTRNMQDEKAMTRFHQEVEVHRRLRIPSIMELYGIGPHPKGVFVVMEYIHGQTLEDYICSQGKLYVLEAIDLTEQILQAMLYAHRRDIIHRDLKPANIFIEEKSHQIKIGDFGLAKFINSQSRDISSTGEVLGTPAFMSPEQIYANKTVGIPSDLYSIGSIFYYMLMGKRPFQEITSLPELGRRKLQSPPRLTNILGVHNISILQSIINRSMASKISRRYAKTTDFIRDLVQAQNQIEHPSAIGNTPHSNIVKKVFQRFNIFEHKDKVAKSSKEEKKNDRTINETFISSMNLPSASSSRSSRSKNNRTIDETFVSSMNLPAVSEPEAVLNTFQEELRTFMSTPSALSSIVKNQSNMSEKDLLTNTVITAPKTTTMKSIEELILSYSTTSDILTVISMLMRRNLVHADHALLSSLRSSILVRGKMLLNDEHIQKIFTKGTKSVQAYLHKYSTLSSSHKMNKNIETYFDSLLTSHIKSLVTEFRVNFEQCHNSYQLKELLQTYPPLHASLLKKYPFLSTLKTIQDIYAEYKENPGSLHTILNKYLGLSKGLRIRRAFEKMEVANDTDCISNQLLQANSLDSMLSILKQYKNSNNAERSVNDIYSIITTFIAPTSKNSLESLKVALNFIPTNLQNKISLLVRQYLSQELSKKVTKLLSSSTSISQRFKQLLDILGNPRYDYPGITIFNYGSQELKQKIESVRYFHKNIHQVFSSSLPASLLQLMEQDRIQAQSSRLKNIDNCLIRLNKWNEQLKNNKKITLFPDIVNLFQHYGNVNFSTHVSHPMTGYEIAQIIMAFYCNPARKSIELPNYIHTDIANTVVYLINTERKSQLKKLN